MPESPKKSEDKQVELQSLKRHVSNTERDVSKLLEEFAVIFEELERNNTSSVVDPQKYGKIAEELRRMKKSSLLEINQYLKDVKSADVLKHSAKSAGDVYDTLIRALSTMEKDVASSKIGDALERAYQKQEAAYQMTRNTRTVNAEHMGLPIPNLPSATQKALVGSKDLQRDALAELENAIKVLGGHAHTIRAADAVLAGEITATLDLIRNKEVKRLSNDALLDISNNRLHSAERFQLEVLNVLGKAKDNLTVKKDKNPSAALAGTMKTGGLLMQALKMQEQALRTTKETDIQKDDLAFSTVLREQGEVSKLLQEALVDALVGTEKINEALEKSKAAGKRLTLRQSEAGRKNQQEALDAIKAALALTQNAERGMAERNEKVEKLREQLAMVRNLSDEQEELLQKTEKVAAEDAHSLARSEKALGDKTEAAAGEPQPESNQGEKALKDAAAAMREATKNLAENKPQDAAAQQRAALSALAQAERNLMSELAATDAAAAAEEAAKNTEQLAAEQNNINQATKEAGDKDQLSQQGEKQESNADKTRQAAEMPGQSQEAQNALKEAAAAMDKAAEALEKGEKQKAETAQNQALAALEKAKSAQQGAQTAAEQKQAEEDKKLAETKMEAPKESQSERVGERTDLKSEGEVKFGDLADLPNNLDWQVALPKKDRVDVEMALKQPFPPKHAKRLRLYYLDLATPEDQR